MLKLTRTLPITIDGTTKTLSVVRVLAKQVLRHPIAPSVPDKPFSIVAGEHVEVVVRAHILDFPALNGLTGADSIPYATIPFGEDTVKAMVKCGEPDMDDHRADRILLTFLLLRVPVHALDVPDDWERDEERSYSRDGLYVTAVRPKPRAEVYGAAPDGRGEWKHIGWSDTGVQFGDPR